MERITFAMNKVFSTLLAGSLLAGLACAGHTATLLQATFAQNGTQAFDLHYTQSGSTYTLSGIVPETITFSGPYTTIGGKIVPADTPIATLLHFTATDTLPGKQSTGTDLDTLSANFVGTTGTLNGVSVLGLTAGPPPTIGNAGILSAGGKSGSVQSNNQVLPANNLLFTSSAIDTSPFDVSSETVTFALTLNSTASYPGFPGPTHLAPGFSALVTGDLAVQTAATTTPEPGSVALAMGALVSFAAFRRRRK
jgi:hypothetical protein